MFYKMNQEQYNKSFEKMKNDMEKDSKELLEILVCNFDRCLKLELSNESKADLIESLNDDFYTGLKSKINRKRNGKGPGNLAGKKCSRIVLDEITENTDNITIKNNNGCVNIGNDNSIITSTTVIRKPKKNY